MMKEICCRCCVESICFCPTAVIVVLSLVLNFEFIPCHVMASCGQLSKNKFAYVCVCGFLLGMQGEVSGELSHG